MQNSQETVVSTEKKKVSLVESFYDWIGAAAVALIVVAIMFATFFRVVNVDGDSMNHTLKDGERLLLSCVNVKPTYGDIVVIQREGEDPLIKRVIGLENDRIYIQNSDGVVLRNGERLEESYAFGITQDRNQDEAIVVPEGMIYVLGDNREGSLDSRQLGCQPLENVVGVITYRLSPFELLRNGD